uniref:Uncharacterized protein n=1 Tax=Parascaris equorum TaxID=6256 RepID=A0A914REF0_PAREQ
MSLRWFTEQGQDSKRRMDDEGKGKRSGKVWRLKGDRQPSGSTVTAPQVDESDFVHDSLGRELECAASRVLELEKEKERILVEAELLRMKLATCVSILSEFSHCKVNECFMHLMSSFLLVYYGNISNAI